MAIVNSYKSEIYPILDKLVKANNNEQLDYGTYQVLKKCLNDIVVEQLIKEVEKLPYNARLRLNPKQPNQWIELTYTDLNLTLDISVSTDKGGNYYLLSYDNIRQVNNIGENRFTVECITRTQDKIKEVARKVFKTGGVTNVI